MKLLSFDVDGYRSLAHVKDVPVGKPAILTGHNDAGKSAALGALEILLAGRDPVLTDFTGDATSVGEDADPLGNPPTTPSETVAEQIAVTGEFAPTEEEQQRIGLGGRIRVRRVIKRDGASHFEYEALLPTIDDLVGYADANLEELKSRCGRLSLTPSGKQNVKATFIEALENASVAATRGLRWAPASDALVKSLPELVSFSSTDEPDPVADVLRVLTVKFREYMSEPAVADAVRTITGELSSRLRSDVDALSKHVLSRVEGLASLTIDPQPQLNPAFRTIEFVAGRAGSKAVPLANSGAGRRRLVTLAVWEWSSLALGSDEESGREVVIAYDEPDTHLDYGRQRQLMDLFREQSQKPNISMVVATHSLNLIDRVDIRDVAHFKLEGGHTVVERLFDDADAEISTFLADLAAAMGFRNSVLLHEQCFLIVEGDTERQAFPRVFRLATGVALQSAGVVLINAGSNNAVLDVASHMKRRGRTVHMMLDSDTKSAESTKKIYRPDRLRGKGFLPDDDITYLGTVELEDMFDDAVWASTANNHWPRDDACDWEAAHFAAYRDGKKFSQRVHDMLMACCEDAPRTKVDLVGTIVADAKGEEDLPPSLVGHMQKVFRLATENG